MTDELKERARVLAERLEDIHSCMCECACDDTTGQMEELLRVELAATFVDRELYRAALDEWNKDQDKLNHAEQHLAALRQQQAKFNAPFVDDEHKLLDSLGIQGTEPDGMGGSVFLSLESRIKLLAQQLAEARLKLEEFTRILRNKSSELAEARATIEAYKQADKLNREEAHEWMTRYAGARAQALKEAAEIARQVGGELQGDDYAVRTSVRLIAAAIERAAEPHKPEEKHP